MGTTSSSQSVAPVTTPTAKVRVHFLSGELVAELELPCSTSVDDLAHQLKQLEPRCQGGRLRLLLGDRILAKDVLLADLVPEKEGGLQLQALVQAGHRFARELPPDVEITSLGKYKMAVIGSTEVGKSALVRSLLRQKFKEVKERTIGAAFASQTVVVDEQQVGTLEIWDTAGQMRFRSLLPMYTRGARFVLLVFDVTVRQSFEDINTFLPILIERWGDEPQLLVLVGNKLDLAQDLGRQVDSEEAQAFAEKHSMLYFEVSATDPEAVERVFFETFATLVDDDS